MFKHSRSARIRQHKPGISPAATFGRDRAPQMKFLRFALAGLLALLLTVFAFAYFTNSSWSALSAIVIEAPPEKVLPLISSPKHWMDWDPWSDPTDDGFEAEFEGPDSGPGAKMKWKSARNHGQLHILGASVAEGVSYELDLDDMPGKGSLHLEPYGVQTRVRWTYSGDLGANLGARVMSSWIQKALQTTMQKGLTNLRARVLAGG